MTNVLRVLAEPRYIVETQVVPPTQVTPDTESISPILTSEDTMQIVYEIKEHHEQIIYHESDVEFNNLGQPELEMEGSPTTPANSKFFVNGIKQGYNIRYMIIGNTLIWISKEFKLSEDDLLDIYYY